jgi:lipoprotein-releasing system permease protein
VRVAIVAITLSVTVMITSTALVAGFKQTISEKIFGFWGHIHISSETELSFEDIPISKVQPFYPNLDTVKSVEYDYFTRFMGKSYHRKARTKGGIRHIQVFANKEGIIKTKEQIEGIVLRGIDKDFDWSFLRRYIVQGDTLTLGDTTSSKNIFISETTAHRLKIKLNDAFDVYFIRDGNVVPRRLRVQGIYRTGLDEYDRKYALVDIRLIQQIKGWSPNQVSGFEVFIDDINDLEPIGNYIWNNTLLGQDLYARTMKELDPNIFDWLELNNLTVAFVLGLMIIVSIVNMTTALMILILERTNMIGILKALGQTNWSIRKIFLYYAVYIISRGLIFGNILGIGLCLAQKYLHFIQLPEDSYYVKVAPVLLNWDTILYLNIGSLITTVVVLIIPSWLVTRITPLKAIRFK